MSDATVASRSFSQWIATTVIYSMFAIFSAVILKSEIYQRKDGSSSFTNNWFKNFSFSCVFFGFIYQLFNALQHVPYLCTFIVYIGSMSSIIQIISLGFYQLSRLYYCFANEQVHFDKGYPKWLFILKSMIGIIMSLCWIILAGMIYIGYRVNTYFSTFILVTQFLFLVWDISILLLFHSVYQCI